MFKMPHTGGLMFAWCWPSVSPGVGIVLAECCVGLALTSALLLDFLAKSFVSSRASMDGSASSLALARGRGGQTELLSIARCCNHLDPFVNRFAHTKYKGNMAASRWKEVLKPNPQNGQASGSPPLMQTCCCTDDCARFMQHPS